MKRRALGAELAAVPLDGARCLLCGCVSCCGGESDDAWVAICESVFNVDEGAGDGDANAELIVALRNASFCGNCDDQLKEMRDMYAQVQSLCVTLRDLKAACEVKLRKALECEADANGGEEAAAREKSTSGAWRLVEKQKRLYSLMRKRSRFEHCISPPRFPRATPPSSSCTTRLRQRKRNDRLKASREAPVKDELGEEQEAPVTASANVAVEGANGKKELLRGEMEHARESGVGQSAVLAGGKGKPRHPTVAGLTGAGRLRTSCVVGAEKDRVAGRPARSAACESVRRARSRKVKWEFGRKVKAGWKLKDGAGGGCDVSGKDGEVFVCPFVDCTRKRRKYVSALLRDVHVRKYHEGIVKKPYACEECAYTCQNKNLLTQHQNFHTGATPFECAEADCGEKFATYQRLVDHKRKKHEEWKLVCATCGKSLRSRLGYKLHLETHSTQPRPKLQCEVCGKTFAQQNSLKHHRRTSHELTAEQLESERRSFACAFCEKVLVGKTRLKFHQRMHTTQYRCQVCNYGAAGRNALNDHVNTVHSDARPFQCRVCEHTFKVKRDLNRHLKTVHPASKDFMCSDCGKRFSNKRYLHDHEQIHKDVKSHACALCGKNFAQRTSLKVHLNSMHKADDQVFPATFS